VECTDIIILDRLQITSVVCMIRGVW